jgi:hypothetical protein
MYIPAPLYIKCIEVETLSEPVYGDSRGRDRMVVGFTTTYAISACHH